MDRGRASRHLRLRWRRRPPSPCRRTDAYCRAYRGGSARVHTVVEARTGVNENLVYDHCTPELGAAPNYQIPRGKEIAHLLSYGASSQGSSVRSPCEKTRWCSLTARRSSFTPGDRDEPIATPIAVRSAHDLLVDIPPPVPPRTRFTLCRRGLGGGGMECPRWSYWLESNCVCMG